MSPPQKKRTLSDGCKGKDVQGVQRAVYVAVRALGKAPLNARNGTYGDGTISDIKTFQRALGIEPSGNTGQPTLNALWPHMDAYGRALYFKAQIGAAPELPNGKLEHGAKGDRVRAAQQMMWRALGESSQNARNSVYGDGLAADVRHYLGIIDAAPGDGRQISQKLWTMLYGFGDEYARELADKAPAGGSDRSELVTWAEWYVAQHGSAYAQIRPYQRDDPPKNPLRNDCSGSSSHIMKLAGFPDPSGNGYNGHGYTGTMMHAGWKVELPRSGAGGLLAGDLVFYGGSASDPQHVAMMLDAGRLFTFGSNPPTITPYASYWTSGRRYEIGARRVIK
jgi:peptidoglycan hydrolase-like protein with peptidoglycan-binding domain